MTNVTSFPQDGAPTDMERRFRDIIFEADDTMRELIAFAHAMSMLIEDRTKGLSKHKKHVLCHLAYEVVDHALDLKGQLYPSGRLPWADEIRDKNDTNGGVA